MATNSTRAGGATTEAALDADAAFQDKFSRQLGAFGTKMMAKLIHMRVLVMGVNGVGIEVAKNLARLGRRGCCSRRARPRGRSGAQIVAAPPSRAPTGGCGKRQGSCAPPGCGGGGGGSWLLYPTPGPPGHERSRLPVSG